MDPLSPNTPSADGPTVWDTDRGASTQPSSPTSDHSEDAFWEQFIQSDAFDTGTSAVIRAPVPWSPLGSPLQAAPPADFSLLLDEPLTRAPSPYLRPPSPMPQRACSRSPVPQPMARLPESPPPEVHPDPGPQRIPVCTVPIETVQTSQQRRNSARRRLRELPLEASAAGRWLLHLRNYAWHRLPNGMAVMRFAPVDPNWAPNDTANYINWLECGAHAHRSILLRCLAVMHIENLNQVFALNGKGPIWVNDYVPDWVDTMRVRPPFMRDHFLGYPSRFHLHPRPAQPRNLRPRATAQEPHDAHTPQPAQRREHPRTPPGAHS